MKANFRKVFEVHATTADLASRDAFAQLTAPCGKGVYPVFIPEEFVALLKISPEMEKAEVQNRLALTASILILGTHIFPEFNTELQTPDGKLAEPAINSGK